MTGDRWVLDASVAAKLLFGEEGAEAAQTWLLSGDTVVSTDFLALEIASVAIKKLRRGDIGEEVAMAAPRDAAALLDEQLPVVDQLDRAARLAVAHGFSAYDATYLALAQAQGCFVLTADLKLAARAEAAGLARFVRRL